MSTRLRLLVLLGRDCPGRIRCRVLHRVGSRPRRCPSARLSRARRLIPRHRLRPDPRSRPSPPPKRPRSRSPSRTSPTRPRRRAVAARSRSLSSTSARETASSSRPARGPAWSMAARQEEGADRVAEELSNLGVSHLNAVLATHPDADHIGDLAAVSRSSAQVAYSDDVGTTQTYGRFIAARRPCTRRSGSVFRGQTLRLGPLTAKVLNPSPDGSDTNADSIVLLLNIDGHRVLLTGDDYGPTEDYVANAVARGPPSTSSRSPTMVRPTPPAPTSLPDPPALRRDLRRSELLRPPFTRHGRSPADRPRPSTRPRSTAPSRRPSWPRARSTGPSASRANRRPTRPGLQTRRHEQLAGTASGSTIVYITATGHCYHRLGCRFSRRAASRSRWPRPRRRGIGRAAWRSTAVTPPEVVSGPGTELTEQAGVAERHGGRTHPGREHRPADGFEDRAGHRTGSRSAGPRILPLRRRPRTSRV